MRGNMSIFKKLAWFFSMRKWQYSIGSFMLILVTMFMLLPPKMIGAITDDIAAGTLTKQSLTYYLLSLALLAVIVYVLRYYWRLFVFGSANYLAKVLRTKLFRHFTQMNAQFYEKRRIGDLMAHATNDISAVQNTAGAGVLMAVDSFFSGMLVIAVMAFTIDWRLTLLALLPMPIVALCTQFYGKLLHKRFGIAQQAFSSLNDKTQESVTGMKVLKTFGQAREDIADFREKSEHVVHANLRVAKIDALFDPTINIVIAMSYLISLSYGAKLITEQAITVGDLIAFTTYLGMLIWPMLALGMLFNIVERGSASYDRIEAILHEPRLHEPANAIQLAPTGDLTIALQSFYYPTYKTVILHNVHVTVKQGETLGIVGKTGAGKSTLLKLLLRQYEVVDGNITFGDKPLAAYTMHALHESIGYVPQDHFLFSATIFHNIALGKPDATMAQVEHAAKLAHIHNDIERLPNRYNTLVGERGVSLSGGQRQRIAIARALLLQPELLLLDDSLSAVDAETEEAILASLRAARTNKTTIITSHRLSAIAHAHHILVLEDGHVIEQGTHAALLAQRGEYAHMYKLQKLEKLVEQGGEN